MSTIAAAPRATRNLSIIVGTDEYNAHVSDVTVKPTPIKWKGGTPTANYVDFTYTLSVTVVHDYQTVDSLYNFMLAHAGEAAEWNYMPDAQGNFTRQVTATIVPPNVGGKVDAFNESTVVMDCSAPVDPDES